MAAARGRLGASCLFCENETNNERLFGVPNASPYVKDGINDYVVAGNRDAVNPERTGTKVAAHHVLEIPAGRERLRSRPPDRSEVAESGASSGKKGLAKPFERLFSTRRDEADQFYATLDPRRL